MKRGSNGGWCSVKLGTGDEGEANGCVGVFDSGYWDVVEWRWIGRGGNRDGEIEKKTFLQNSCLLLFLLVFFLHPCFLQK